MDAKRASRIIGLLALAATGVVALPLIAGFFARLHPAFDSLAHFRMHLAVLLLIAAIPLLFLRGFRWNGVMATALGAGAILSVVGISTLVGPGASQAALQPDDETAAVYKLLHLNLRYDNPEHGKVLSLIGRLMPDVVTLNEVSPAWAEKIALLAGSYRYRIVCHIDNHAGGVAILSLRPFAEGDEGKCLEGGTFATAKLDFGGNTRSKSARCTCTGRGRSTRPTRSRTWLRCLAQWAMPRSLPAISTPRRGAPPRRGSPKPAA